MISIVVVGFLCLAGGFCIGHFMNSAKISKIEEEVSSFKTFASAETNALATKIRSLL